MNVPPQFIPTIRGGRLLIFDLKCYYVKRRLEIEHDLFDFQFGLGEYVLQLKCSHQNCKCPARCHYNEVTDVYSDFKIVDGYDHTEECVWNLPGVCLEVHKHLLYMSLADGTFTNLRDAYTNTLIKWRMFYGIEHFPPQSYFKT